MARIAGMESTANRISVVSSARSTASMGVAKRLPFLMMKILLPEILWSPESRNEAFYRNIFIRMHLSLFVQCQFYSGINQKSTENVHDPVEFVNERDARENKCGTGNQCQQDAPEKRLVFISGRHVEKPKKSAKKRKELSYAQRCITIIIKR